MRLDGIWQDRRFGDCINAFLEHGIVDPHTLDFPRGRAVRQGPELDRDNEYQQSRCLEEVRARIQRGKSELRASLEVAAEWGLPGASLDAVATGLRDKLRALRKRP
jgi:hypothetical protein